MLDKKSYEAVVLQGGRVVDPYTGRDEAADVFVVDGLIAAEPLPGAEVIDVSGMIVCPGLMDIHVHLREPGYSDKETIETGTAAACAGGFTYVACMPNTAPTVDEPSVVEQIQVSAQRANHCEVGVIAAITHRRAGKTLVDFTELHEAGAVAFSDDGVGVEKDDVMKMALEQAAKLSTVLIQHCEYQAMSAGGVMHQGEVSARLDLPGLDPRSEEAMIERDIELCRQTGGRYHVAHISTAKAVQLVREAKLDGVPVTAEVCTHHLLLTDEACLDRNTNTKMHPPLRPIADVEACRKGLVDGTIDCIVTDHAPHTLKEKSVEFQKAPPGIVGLETALGLAAKAMIDTGLADWPKLIDWFTRRSAQILGISQPSIECGAKANLTVIDPSNAWVVDPQRFLTKGRSTPFGGWELCGRAEYTIRGCHVTKCHG